MDILVIEQRYTSPRDAGIARFSILAKYWAAAGHKVNIISGMIDYITGRKRKEYQGKYVVPEKEGEDITVYRVFDTALGYRTFFGRLVSYFSFLISAFWSGLSLPRSDVIIVSSPPIFIGLVALALSRLKRIPLVFDVRDLWPDAAVELGYVRNRVILGLSYFIEKFMYRKADAIVIISPGMKQYLNQSKGVPVAKIHVVPNPVELDLISVSEEARCGPANNWRDKFVVMYSGAHSAVYDFDTLLDAAGELAAYQDILFVLAGDGRQKPHVAARVRAEKMENVLLLPPVPKAEVGSLLDGADICLALHKPIQVLQYGFPAKPFDYMALKKPVILAMEGEVVDLVSREADCGVVVEPGDKKALAEAVLSLYRDPEQRRILGENGYRYIQKHRRADQLAGRYLDLLTRTAAP